MISTYLLRFRFALAALAGVLQAPNAMAQGDLLVAPTRVIINSGGNAEVVLSNIGKEAATYRIMLELRRMNEEGELTEIPEAEASPAEKAALEMVRYAPRRIVLAPGQPQAVRITVRPPEGLADGEYRVHMVFRSIPAAVSPEEAARARAAGEFSIRLQPVYGISIPVFIRKGRLDVSAQLGAASLVREASGSAIAVEIVRTGARSVYGEVVARNSRGEQIALVRGVAVYPEVGKVTVQLPLTADQLAKAKGPIRIEYREMPEAGGRTLAETTTTLN